MKPETYYLITPLVLENTIRRLREIGVNRKIQVTIQSVSKKSTKQRGLQWMWYTEVAKAGIGGKWEDTKYGVHLISKWRWAIPILIRDDEHFNDLFTAWYNLYKHDEERMRWFVEAHVHTEDFSSKQMAEFLTDFQRHYGQLVNLTDPDDKNLLRAA